MNDNSELLFKAVKFVAEDHGGQYTGFIQKNINQEDLINSPNSIIGCYQC
jgi:hypothetical protein